MNNNYNANEYENSINEIENHATPMTETTEKSVRKTKEEQLALALAKRQSLDVEINRRRKELNEKNKKERNHGLLLVGLVVEQIIKKGEPLYVSNIADHNWWLNQVHLLLPKDKEAYVEFCRSLVDSMKQ